MNDTDIIIITVMKVLRIMNHSTLFIPSFFNIPSRVLDPVNDIAKNRVKAIVPPKALVKRSVDVNIIIRTQIANIKSLAAKAIAYPVLKPTESDFPSFCIFHTPQFSDAMKKGTSFDNFKFTQLNRLSVNNRIILLIQIIIGLSFLPSQLKNRV